MRLLRMQGWESGAGSVESVWNDCWELGKENARNFTCFGNPIIPEGPPE